MNNQFYFPVCITEQEGGYLIQFPDFPEAITQGDTLEDSLQQAIDCLEEAIANRIELKIDLPSSNQNGDYVISPHTTFAAKAFLRLTARELNLNNLQLAERLGCDEKEVRRLLNFQFPSKLPRIEDALRKLGKRINIEMVPC